MTADCGPSRDRLRLGVGPCGPRPSGTQSPTACRPGAPPTLSFMAPTEPYVSSATTGGLDEVDGAIAGMACPSTVAWSAAARSPRRRPALLPDHRSGPSVSPGATAALAASSQPAVVGLPGRRRRGRARRAARSSWARPKVSGHGAGQIGDAVVVVGNLIERFDHSRGQRRPRRTFAQRPGPKLRRRMGRYVTATPADRDPLPAAAVTAYAAALGLDSGARPLSRGSGPTGANSTPVRDTALGRGPARPAPATWQAKVRAGVWVVPPTTGRPGPRWWRSQTGAAGHSSPTPR